MSKRASRATRREGPTIRRLTRREVLKYGGLAGGAAAAGALAWAYFTKAPRVAAPEGYKVLKLSKRLGPNPAFCAKALADGGALAWVYRRDGSMVAYALNAEGRLIWRCCNARRTQAQICEEFASRSGRPREEAREFVGDLRSKGLVVQGGYMVAPAGFPESTAQRYFRRIEGEKTDAEVVG